ncbi:ABATE domain-containing protein [Cellulomonas fengjieae]|uniref:ABATE domain-containing protein n=1 Tax=Cellulomonas fengjieae TaxID=2819978 RepID=UPI001AAFC23B|nr:ABATE domain-containing protein [Cellulomonas fengjieae]MBO3103483.1 ABATE domain-containing protein [Cellulomonas fengjieae]
MPELVGGAVCLDIANSVDGRVLAVPEDHLRSYADVVDRVVRAGGLAADEGDALLARAAATPDAAAELVRARDLRESVFAVFHLPDAVLIR